MSRILSGQWPPDSRIPSVRELAVELAVNTHTVLKAFDILADSHIIVSQRGMGYFLTPDARSRVVELRKTEFFNDTLPGLARAMQELGITVGELADHLAPHLAPPPAEA